MTSNWPDPDFQIKDTFVGRRKELKFLHKELFEKKDEDYGRAWLHHNPFGDIAFSVHIYNKAMRIVHLVKETEKRIILGEDEKSVKQNFESIDDSLNKCQSNIQQKIIVVDNNSIDNSKELLQTWFRGRNSEKYSLSTFHQE